VYHGEAEPASVRERLAHASRSTPPFPLRLGGVARFPAPSRGAFLAVEDPHGAVAALRRIVLAPPSTPRERFGLHVTLLHPSAGERLDDAWPEIATLEGGASFRVETIELITGSGARTRTLDSFALEGAA
jgi:2'-5' RNA ligase